MKKSSKKDIFGKKLKVEDYEFALSYCRVSGVQQETDGSGLDSQATRNQQLADRYNLKVEKVFRDTFTGGGDFMKRPKMGELLKYLDAHAYKKYVVIFDDLKRFARDTKFHFELRDALKARNALPLCSNFVFDDTPEGVFVETIQAAHNQLEREQNRRQVIEKQRACLERGYRPFHSLYGYKKEGRGSNKRDIPNEHNRYIKELFEGFFSGRFHQFIEGARYLKEMGVFGKAHPEKYIETVKSILTEPFYAGFIEFPKWEVARREGIHEPTISYELFEAIQKKITGNFYKTKVRQDINPDFPLRGLVNCSMCGTKLRAAWSQGKNEKFPYYYCKKKSCPLRNMSIRKKYFEEKFDVLLKEMETEDDIVELGKVVFEKAKEKDKIECELESRERQRRKKEIEAEIENYAKTAAKPTTPESVKAQYEKLIAKLADELEEIELNEAPELDYGIPYQTALDRVLGTLKNPYEEWIKLNPLQQHRFFNFLFEVNLVYDLKTGYQTPKYTVLKRVLGDIEDSGSVDVEMGGIEPPCI